MALALAERMGGVVVNADSMQVYRELSVLTARPTAADEARAPHRLYGHVAGAEAYSAGRFAREAKAEIEAALAAGRWPIVVGGTGLYFKALTDGLSPIPEVPGPVRAFWRAVAERIGAGALHGELARRDAVMAGRLRPSDPQRVTRALEVLDATGRSLAHWQALAPEPMIDAAAAVRLVVAPDQAASNQRCDARFDAMLRDGALDEVRGLVGLGLDPGLPVMLALGVRPLVAHLRGERDLASAAAAARTETRHFVKRQMTWLARNMSAWKWLSTQEIERYRGEVFSFIDP